MRSNQCRQNWQTSLVINNKDVSNCSLNNDISVKCWPRMRDIFIFIHSFFIYSFIYLYYSFIYLLIFLFIIYLFYSYLFIFLGGGGRFKFLAKLVYFSAFRGMLGNYLQFSIISNLAIDKCAWVHVGQKGLVTILMLANVEYDILPLIPQFPGRFNPVLPSAFWNVVWDWLKSVGGPIKL